MLLLPRLECLTALAPAIEGDAESTLAASCWRHCSSLIVLDQGFENLRPLRLPAYMAPSLNGSALRAPPPAHLRPPHVGHTLGEPPISSTPHLGAQRVGPPNTGHGAPALTVPALGPTALTQPALTLPPLGDPHPLGAPHVGPPPVVPTDIWPPGLSPPHIGPPHIAPPYLGLPH